MLGQRVQHGPNSEPTQVNVSIIITLVMTAPEPTATNKHGRAAPSLPSFNVSYAALSTNQNNGNHSEKWLAFVIVVNQSEHWLTLVILVISATNL